MRAFLYYYLRGDDGQDLVEYSLLLAFVVVVTAALFLYNSDAVASIWTRSTSELDAANTAANS